MWVTCKVQNEVDSLLKWWYILNVGGININSEIILMCTESELMLEYEVVHDSECFSEFMMNLKCGS